MNLVSEHGSNLPDGSRQIVASASVENVAAGWGDWQTWGDQGDGTYRNPVLPADYSDLDCIRVGDEYYAISSTMQLSPGMVVLRSRDLVNWRIVGHAVADTTQIGPEMNWDRMNRYGRGVWAGAIRHHDGKFWVYFGTPEEGFFMTTAADPAGPWAPLHPLMRAPGWDDCCPFWDEDGQGYFIGTHFADGYKTYIWKMTPDGRALVEDSKTQINQGAGREASKLYKINGWYYHFFSEVADGVRVMMMQRSRSVMGPYTERRQLGAANREWNEPNQGGLIDTGPGGWQFLTHHGAGDWAGRCMSLLPVTWVDDWPIIGATSNGEPGKMVLAARKPIHGFPVVMPQSRADFSEPVLGPQWEWNHQPRADKWSLTERPGFLRLKAFKPLQPDNLMTAGNTLSQRTFRTPKNDVVAEFDLSGMADGQKAGLCHFAKDHSALGVVQDGAIRRIEYRENGKLTEGPVMEGNQLWFKSSWGLDGRSQYAYSLDGRAFTPFGDEYQLVWGHYRGDRVGLYSFNNKQEAGHVDVKQVRYDYRAKPDFSQALIPDLVADPSISELNGTFYCYATTDGWGRHLETSGTPVVWTSKDFLNWKFEGSSFPPDFDLKYWAPSTVVHRNGRYYSFPTLDGKITAVVADSPTGPFLAPDGRHVTQATLQPFPIDQSSAIDAEVFIDDDDQAYMVLSRRRLYKLKPDLLSPDGPVITLPTKREGYSEGPFLTKRNGIYYYFYTLGGNEVYSYAYMMSRGSPLGPWEAPEQDIIAVSDHGERVFGPGHGCFFRPQDRDEWYFVYLEFGRGGTNRQIHADRMIFNPDGTIQPIKLTKTGVGALRKAVDASPDLALGAVGTASSTREDFRVAPISFPELDRVESYSSALALDGLNGTRWMAAVGDAMPWFQVDLGAPRDIRRTEAYFVKPAAGHAYRLEWSLDGQSWEPYGGHEEVILRSPHRDEKPVRAQYLKLTILKGEPGLWGFRVY
jgi:beta-xylosidase